MCCSIVKAEFSESFLHAFMCGARVDLGDFPLSCWVRLHNFRLFERRTKEELNLGIFRDFSDCSDHRKLDDVTEFGNIVDEISVVSCRFRSRIDVRCELGRFAFKNWTIVSRAEERCENNYVAFYDHVLRFTDIVLAFLEQFLINRVLCFEWCHRNYVVVVSSSDFLDLSVQIAQVLDRVARLHLLVHCVERFRCYQILLVRVVVSRVLVHEPSGFDLKLCVHLLSDLQRELTVTRVH